MAELLVDVAPFQPVLTESKKRPGVFYVEGKMQAAGKENKNGRIYEKEILVREANRYMKEFVKTNTAYGELDHPESPIVELKNASHIVRDLWWSGDDLMGKVELLNTPCGNIVKALCQAGCALGISSRGTGSVQQTNEGYLEVQDDFELVCWDFVSNPSTHGAFLSPVSLSESVVKNINKFAGVNSVLNDLLKV